MMATYGNGGNRWWVGMNAYADVSDCQAASTATTP